MKASQLIIELAKLLAKHGDLPVKYYDSLRREDNTIMELAYYDEEGEMENCVKAIEFYIH